MTNETPKHTPEPWHVAAYEATPSFREIQWHEAICKDEGPGVAQGDLLAVVGPAHDPKSIADAERIVTCVNAMAGVANPQAQRDAADALATAAQFELDRYDLSWTALIAKYGDIERMPTTTKGLRDALDAYRTATGGTQ